MDITIIRLQGATVGFSKESGYVWCGIGENVERPLTQSEDWIEIAVALSDGMLTLSPADKVKCLVEASRLSARWYAVTRNQDGEVGERSRFFREMSEKLYIYSIEEDVEEKCLRESSMFRAKRRHGLDHH